jgi:hypothetical protein
MKTFTFVQHSENTDNMAMYDEKGNLITNFQSGDDLSRVLKRILAPLNVALTVRSLNCEEFPDKISNS